MLHMHPLQPAKTAQGVLEIMYKTGELLRAISGLDVFSVQPGGGSHGVLALASVVRAYWRDKGEEEKRDEIITTLFSHPADAAVPIVKGYKVTSYSPILMDIPISRPSKQPFRTGRPLSSSPTPKTPAFSTSG